MVDLDKKYTILVVEDEGLLRELLVEKMNIEGFETLEANDGDIGLEIALDKKPDMILLDMLMPRMSGMEMLKRLRADERGRSIPVIVLSNLNEKESVAESAEQGVIEYLIKSNFSLEDIVVKIREIGHLRGWW
jgi:CheY-like chemotaxis protein